MPIRIPDALPAAAQLESENIFVMTEYRALHQDIRPLRVLILNLMPTKIATETQIMRKLSNTPLQVEVDLLRTKTHEATHVSAGHLETFYRTFDDIRDIQAGRAAGMGTVAAAYGYLGSAEPIDAWQADVIIQHPLEILTLLGNR